MNRISRNISIVLRAERLMAQRRMAVMRTQAGLMAFAAIVGGLALVMLNVAGFFALRTTLSPQWAALIVAGVNIVLAAILIAAASRMSAKAELEPVTELRDMAIEEIETDLQAAAGEARELADNVRRIAQDPLGTMIPGVLLPLLTSFLKSDKD